MDDSGIAFPKPAPAALEVGRGWSQRNSILLRDCFDGRADERRLARVRN